MAGSACAFAPQGLMHSSGPVGRHRQLVLVLEGELYLIPFALLKGSASNEYLYERFALIAVPAIRSLGPHSKVTWGSCGGVGPDTHRASVALGIGAVHVGSHASLLKAFILGQTSEGRIFWAPPTSCSEPVPGWPAAVLGTEAVAGTAGSWQRGRPSAASLGVSRPHCGCHQVQALSTVPKCHDTPTVFPKVGRPGPQGLPARCFWGSVLSFPILSGGREGLLLQHAELLKDLTWGDAASQPDTREREEAHSGPHRGVWASQRWQAGIHPTILACPTVPPPQDSQDAKRC